MIAKSSDLEAFLARIEAAVADGEARLRTPGGAANGDDALCKCIDGAMLIGAYQLYVHREWFDPLSRHDDPRIRATVVELKTECIMLAADLRDRVKAISQTNPLDLERLRAEARSSNALVRSHIAKVRALIAALDRVTAAAA